MFLVGNNDIYGYLMTGGFCLVGIFFVAVGCACIDGYDNSDIKQSDVRGSFSKKAGDSQVNNTNEKSTLLDEA